MQRVLIVEDEETLGDALADSLREDGLEVQLARNGVDAWRILERGVPDLLLLDLMLPLLDGASLLDRMRQQGMASVPVIVLTSATREALGARPVVAFLEKPVTFDKLLQTVRRIMTEQVQ